MLVIIMCFRWNARDEISMRSRNSALEYKFFGFGGSEESTESCSRSLQHLILVVELGIQHVHLGLHEVVLVAIRLPRSQLQERLVLALHLALRAHRADLARPETPWELRHR